MPAHPAERRLRLCVVQLDGVLHARTTTDLWLPAEPLLDPDNGHGASELTAASLFTLGAKHIYDGVQQLCTTATAACLSELLTILSVHTPDVVVFPEYQMPLSYLPNLLKFSRDRAVVAGMGYVRNNAEAAALAEMATTKPWTTQNLVRRNVSVLVENERVHLITKRTLAESEVADEGTGVLVEDLVLRGRQVRLAVAVCMDYLQLENDATQMAAEIVCIPANSPKVGPFLPDEPRDHIRMLANCAVHGGSQIMMPALKGPLTTKLGVHPIPAGYQGVIMVEYDRYPQRPSAKLKPENSLLLRAEIVEKIPDNEPVLAVIRELGEVDANLAPAHLQEQVTGWLGRINGSGPLTQALRAYQGALAQDFDVEKGVHDLARTHFPVESGRRRDAIRGLQARFILERLQELDAADPDTNFGQARDAYLKLANKLQVTSADGSLTVRQNTTVLMREPEPKRINPGGLLQFTFTTARDGTRSEKLEIFDPELARELAREFLSSQVHPDDVPKDT